jgi:hypothetical protein
MGFSEFYAHFEKIVQSLIISLLGGLLFFHTLTTFFMNNQKDPKETNSRRKLIAGIGALSLFPLAKLGFFNKKKDVISCAPEAGTKKIKLLTQDGTLVEVDMSKIKSSKQKISNEQLQSWVKKEL